jgi:hypothetical protein
MEIWDPYGLNMNDFYDVLNKDSIKSDTVIETVVNIKPKENEKQNEKNEKKETFYSRFM